MKDHLVQCLQEQNMTFLKTRHTAMKFKSLINLCKCRMQKLPQFTIIGCSNCKAWHHVDCVSAPLKALLNGFVAHVVGIARFSLILYKLLLVG